MKPISLTIIYSVMPLTISTFATAQDAFDTAGENDTDTTTGEGSPQVIDDNPYEAGPTPKESPVDSGPPWQSAWAPEDNESVANELSSDSGESTYLPPPPPPPPAQLETPCSAISCSGRGSCVIKNGEPTCACFQGFVPDNVNGLNCIPESPAREDKNKSWDYETYYRNLETALGNFDTRGKLAEYRTKIDRNTWKGTFPEYLRRSFKRSQNIGTIELAFGLAGFAGGLSMHMLYAGYPNRSGLLAGAIILDIGGLALISSGAAALAVGSSRAKKLQLFDHRRRNNPARLMVFPPGLYLTGDMATVSWGASF